MPLLDPQVLIRSTATAAAHAHTGGPLKIELARTEAQQSFTWQPDLDAHLLIGAHPGAGGTTALCTAVLGWTATGGTAWLIDPYHRRLEGLRDWPNVDAVAGQGEKDAAAALLTALHAAMQRRYLDLLEGTVQHEDLTPILLAIDEFTDFTGWCEQARATQTHQLLDEVLRKGRGARIHLAVRTTSCRRQDLGGQQVGAFGQRVWIGPASELDSLVLWSTPHAAELGSPVRGRAIVSDAHGGLGTAQIVWTPDPSDQQLSVEDQQQLQALRPTVRHR